MYLAAPRRPPPLRRLRPRPRRVPIMTTRSPSKLGIQRDQQTAVAECLSAGFSLGWRGKNLGHKRFSGTVVQRCARFLLVREVQPRRERGAQALAAATEHGVLTYAEHGGSGCRSGARQCESALMV